MHIFFERFGGALADQVVISDRKEMGEDQLPDGGVRADFRRLLRNAVLFGDEGVLRRGCSPGIHTNSRGWRPYHYRLSG